MIKQVWQAKIVNKNVIFGLISGYISLGLIGFFVCLAIELASPGSFEGLKTIATNADALTEQLMYFSYITLLTIGYGDILPVTSLAQKAAILIGLMGQIYLVVLTAIVVGKYINQSLQTNEKNWQKNIRYCRTNEKGIIIVLLFSLLLVVLYTGIVFLGLLFGGILDGIQNSFSVEQNIMVHLHKVFGGFLSVLMGIELLHTMKMYLKEDVVHVEIVLLVALIGVSRHVIDLDVTHLEPMTLFGISSLIIVLSRGYFLIKKGMRQSK